jgi:four helix bundle protein
VGRLRYGEQIVECLESTDGQNASVSGPAEAQLWQRSHSLALGVYRITREVPATDHFKLVSRLRKAAVAMAAFIDQGAKRQARREQICFLDRAEDALAEMHCLVILGRHLGYLTGTEPEVVLGRMAEITRLLQALRAPDIRGRP